jgi:hypothetical protein
MVLVATAGASFLVVWLATSDIRRRAFVTFSSVGGGLLFLHARIEAPALPLVITVLVIAAGRFITRRSLADTTGSPSHSSATTPRTSSESPPLGDTVVVTERRAES